MEDKFAYHHEKADEFLENVNNITSRIDAIIKGDVTVMEEEQRFADEEKMKEVKNEIKKREEEEKIAKGIPGRGFKGNFKTFCKGCHTEYHHEAVEKCNNCGKDTVSNEERMADLRERLEEHKVKKAKKMERRAKWENWKKTQGMFHRKTSTNYAKWDVFESETESENEEDKEPILPENDPQFQAMEADLNERSKRRKRNRKEANRLKEKGNDCMKRGLYKSANHHYSAALDEAKDILPIYTNRALARLRLEMWQEVVDDCTRVLEYCEVFDDGYTVQRDLCYKALSRRAQGFRALNDFTEAIKDLAQAKLLCPDQEDCQRLIDQYKADKELAQRIATVMENAEGLAGKEYIDFLLNAVQGKIPQSLSEVSAGKPNQADAKKAPRYCQHAVKPEEAKKLGEILKGQADLVLYFNAHDGLRSLVQSLEYNTECLDLLMDLIVDNEQLTDDFQRNHQYEALIDFMYKKNVNAEGATLAADAIHKIMQILENGSMNEAVRMNLSEKKKVKDLFLVVIRAIDIDKNRPVVASLIQFASNLCYGTGKFRRLLIANEAPTEFIATLSNILSSVSKPIDIAEAMAKAALASEEEKKEEPSTISDEGKRILLKGTVLNFIGNLCVEAQLRQFISQDMGGLLTQIMTIFSDDVANKRFDWIDSGARALQTLVNCSLEAVAQNKLASTAFDKTVETIFKTLPVCPQEKEQKEIIERVIQWLGRLAKVEAGWQKILASKDIMLKLIVYYSMPDTNKNTLIVLHCLTGKPGFKSVCYETHGFTAASFDSFVSTGKANFKKLVEEQKWDEYFNCTASLTGFVGAFPERAIEFQDLIVPLIKVCSDKTDRIRKNSAVLLAKLATDEANKKVMQANHGTEVLCSVQNSLF